jgi:proteic killer suppression protein
MISSFRCRETEALFKRTGIPARWRTIATVALRKLNYLHAARKVEDLQVPPGNRLEKLKGARAGQWSIRINRQWRLCFEWHGEEAANVEIVDYH